MKKIIVVTVLALLGASGAFGQSGNRIVGAQQLQLDDNNPAHARVYLTTVNGSLGIDQSGIPAAGTFPSPCALLDLSSTTQGFLVPRMTAAQEALICSPTPTEGLIVYNTTTHQLDVFNGSFWGTTGWALNGNNLTGGSSLTPNQYFGSNNNYDVVMKTNNIERMRLGSSLAINAVTITGPASALNALQINGNASTARGINVDMTTNPVTIGASSAVGGSITGAPGIGVTGATFSATSSGNGGAGGVSGSATVTSGFGYATGVAGSATTTGSASGNLSGVTGTATSSVAPLLNLIVGVTGNGNGLSPSQAIVLGGDFNGYGAASTSITSGVQGNATAGGGGQALAGWFNAMGANTNIGVLANAAGPTGLNIGVDIQSQGTNSVGLRIGTSYAPNTGISVTNATTTGIDIAGAPTSINASATIQTTGDVKVGAANAYTATSGVERFTAVSGLVNGNGTIATGAGFTVVRNAVGDYTITSTEAKIAFPIFTFSAATPGANGPYTVNWTVIVTTIGVSSAININIRDRNGVLTDAAFLFTMMAPR